MKKTFFLALLLGLLAQGAHSQTIQTIKIKDLVSHLQKNDDTLRVVNLWATWCAPCVKELPYFEQAHQHFKNQKVKIILTAIEDELPKVQAFAQKRKLQSTLLFLDEDNANDWIPQIEKNWQGEIPVTLFVKQGKREFHSGDFTAEELMTQIEQRLNVSKE
ncbi:MAG: TlpA family protein disulfide reductase [Microscillaceae bacterium]|jgi:thiol-disulfide isomerase/thioredoxin|nr:TlpA family protein disulfide reductase [Microscillaceae bacterium]